MKWADSIALGPGWGRDKDSGELSAKILGCGKRMVIDADGLNLIVQQQLMDHLPRGCVLTPHAGELERLVGRELLSAYDRIAAARKIAAQHGVVVHVKGSSSATVAPDGKVYINTTGNPGLATGGSGDVLTGMVGSLLAQEIASPACVWGAAYLHGRAADLGAASLGEVSLLPSDVVGHLPRALASLDTAVE
ncbi:MAG: NAD(P)H-hydrate dehydratase [bacterium]|nr:NAD(P)H-hydrate dehydratase [bacterium]